MVHWLNGSLRARPLTAAPLADSLKYLAARTAKRALRSLGRG
jgi:hypothetical protein